MSDSDEERDAIRQRKRDELLQGQESTTGDGATGAATPVHIDGTAHLQEVLSENHVVLVDFYADWCGPCKMLEPTVEELAAESAATVAKVDIDTHQTIASQFNVRGVPTVYLFVGGEPAQQWVGVRDKGTYASAIQQHA